MVLNESIEARKVKSFTCSTFVIGTVCCVWALSCKLFFGSTVAWSWCWFWRFLVCTHVVTLKRRCLACAPLSWPALRPHVQFCFSCCGVNSGECDLSCACGLSVLVHTADMWLPQLHRQSVYTSHTHPHSQTLSACTSVTEQS